MLGPPQRKEFQEAKPQLTSAYVMVHYNPQQEVILACDASPYGVGAVLSHQFEDGSEQPIAFASQSLSPAEKRYSQLDKEGLAIVCGVKKFHHYLHVYSEGSLKFVLTTSLYSTSSVRGVPSHKLPQHAFRGGP